MHQLFLALVMVGVTVATAAASAKEDAISVVHQWVDGFNNGDAKSLVSTCADQASLIDDFPPHEWHGTGACAKWFSDFQAMAKVVGSSKSVIAVGNPSHIELSLKFAYVVAPVTLSFERKGQPVKENGLLTVTLRKSASGWRITGWVWSDQ
jgi:ketosteroid isomerase-like protein